MHFRIKDMAAVQRLRRQKVSHGAVVWVCAAFLCLFAFLLIRFYSTGALITIIVFSLPCLSFLLEFLPRYSEHRAQYDYRKILTRFPMKSGCKSTKTVSIIGR